MISTVLRSEWWVLNPRSALDRLRLGFRLASFHDLDDAPVLLFTDRPGVNQFHPITDLAHILFVMRLQSRDAANDLLVDTMPHESIHGHDDRLFHLVADDVAEP